MHDIALAIAQNKNLAHKLFVVGPLGRADYVNDSQLDDFKRKYQQAMLEIQQAKIKEQEAIDEYKRNQSPKM